MRGGSETRVDTLGMWIISSKEIRLHADTLRDLCMQSSLTVRAYPAAALESDGVERGRERFLSNLAHHIPNVVLQYGA